MALAERDCTFGAAGADEEALQQAQKEMSNPNRGAKKKKAKELKAKGVTVKAIAERLGLKVGTVSQYLSAK